MGFAGVFKGNVLRGSVCAVAGVWQGSLLWDRIWNNRHRSPSGINYTSAPRALRIARRGNIPTVSGISKAQCPFLAVDWWWGQLPLVALGVSLETPDFPEAPGGGLEPLVVVGGGSFHRPPLCSPLSHPPHCWAPPSCSVFALEPFAAAGTEATQGFCERRWRQVSYWPELRRFSLIGAEHGWPGSLRITQFLTVWGWELMVRPSSFVVWSWFVRLPASPDSQTHTEEVGPSHPLSSPI